jgi:hypothetical protein
MSRHFIEDLGVEHASAKFIPQLLTEEQEENCLSVTSHLPNLYWLHVIANG